MPVILACRRPTLSTMPISKKSVKPIGVTNEQGEPEIVLTVGDLKLSMAPPPKPGDHAAEKATDHATDPASEPDDASR
jgi:hypothetical protein